MIITLVLLIIFTISAVAYLWFELSITSDRVEWLSERLYKLEKDAVKVTFTPPFTTYDEKIVVHPQVKTKPYPKKRKPKTVKEWEEEVDLGGHE